MGSRTMVVVLLLCAALGLVACDSGGQDSGERASGEEEDRTVTRVVTVREPAPPETTRAAPNSGEVETTTAQEESPEDVLATQYRLINAGDYEGAYALFAEGSKQLVSAEQYRAFFEANAPYSVVDYTFPTVDVVGDAAIVGATFTVNSSAGQEYLERTQELVREGGVWRVVMRDEQVASFAATGQETAQYEPSSSPQYESADASDDGGGTETVTIRVVGDPGLAFTGNYGNIDTSRSVEGTTPAEFQQEVEAGILVFDSVSVVMQNASGAGELLVQLIVAGEVVKEASTTAQYGAVSVTYTPGE